MVEEGDPIACGFLDSGVPGTGDALVLLLDVANAVAEGACDFFGSILRPIIDDENFMSQTGLGQGALKGFTETGFGIIGGYGDTDLGHVEGF